MSGLSEETRRMLDWTEADEPDAAWRAQQAQWATDLAWHRWRVHSCVEFNGGHDLRLQKLRIGDEPELACAHGCGVTIDDFHPDGWDLVLFDLPVAVEIEHVHYPATPDHGDEYDTFIGLEPRYPVDGAAPSVIG